MIWFFGTVVAITNSVKNASKSDFDLPSKRPSCSIFGIILASKLMASQAALSADIPNPAFAGRWDLTIENRDHHQMASWLEISFEHGNPRARFVGRWGNARPLPETEITGNQIFFVSPKDEEGSTNDLVFRGELTHHTISGTALGPNGASWAWTAKRAPALPRPERVIRGKRQILFDGVDLAGWSFDNPQHAASWKVQDGCLVNQSAGANLVTTNSFQNFKLHYEVNCPSNANSGVYLRGRYEVQVEDDSLAEPPSHHMGAIYGFLAPKPEPPRHPGEWQSFDITLLGRFVTVVQNGETIIDNQEIPGITGGALDSHEESPGPIYLQGDHGGIAFRSIFLTPLKP